MLVQNRFTRYGKKRAFGRFDPVRFPAAEPESVLRVEPADVADSMPDPALPVPDFGVTVRFRLCNVFTRSNGLPTQVPFPCRDSCAVSARISSAPIEAAGSDSVAPYGVKMSPSG